MSSSKYAVTAEKFNSISSGRAVTRFPLSWNQVFVLPEWLELWWRHFGGEYELELCGVRESGELIGISPLMIKGKTAFLIGSEDVCDYLDFVVSQGKEQVFFKTLLGHLKKEGIDCVDLMPVRPDSTVYAHLAPIARESGCEVFLSKADVSLEMDLPVAWDDYLYLLNGKQRHEIRRKFRRLHEAGDINYRVVQEFHETVKTIDLFFTLFIESREDKAAFMSERMRSFFRQMVESLSKLNILKLYILAIDSEPAAIVLCFDYNSTVYLYNSGYDPKFRSLSVGLLCKALSIRESIREKRRRFDFLKGAEDYKYRMGGTEVPLYSCRITL
ncbi:MAG: GNAT family N-acetyltransferase [Deltaproteobacteria bacterium]|nr:GNAT family N-acetyltransferase [Deltaproteobacteria bacterium]